MCFYRRMLDLCPSSLPTCHLCRQSHMWGCPHKFEIKSQPNACCMRCVGCVCVLSITRCTTTLSPKAGLGLQRSSARRQPIVQTQILVVQGLLCGHSSLTEKGPYYREKGWAYRGKGGQNIGAAFPALRLGVVLYLLAHCFLMAKCTKACDPRDLLQRSELEIFWPQKVSCVFLPLSLTECPESSRQLFQRTTIPDTIWEATGLGNCL